MYKRLLLSTFIALSFVGAKADLAPTVMLRHNGNTTFYKYYQVQQAVDAAADGDTIYLTEGTYRPFNINKRIMVRGAGETTIIDGNCEIDINGTQKLSMPVLDALCFNGDVIVTNAYSQLTLRKIKMTNLLFDAAEHNDVKLTQCYITNRLNLTNNVKEFNVFNTRIQVLYPHDYMGGQATFEHCNIHEICDTIQGGVFNSCAIKYCSKFSGASSSRNLIACVLNSCVYGDIYCSSSTTLTDCSYISTGWNTWGSDTNYNGGTSALDGTKIGAYGGQHPYTLAPELPTVSKYQLSVDSANKTMFVNLTVTKP